MSAATDATEARADDAGGAAAAVDERDVRALTEYFTVLADQGRVRGAPDLYLVVSESGREYIVDTRTGACECPDAEYRDPEGGCKHRRRVAFAIGGREIPAAVDPDAVDDQLGAHVDGPVWDDHAAGQEGDR